MAQIDRIDIGLVPTPTTRTPPDLHFCALGCQYLPTSYLNIQSKIVSISADLTPPGSLSTKDLAIATLLFHIYVIANWLILIFFVPRFYPLSLYIWYRNTYTQFQYKWFPCATCCSAKYHSEGSPVHRSWD